MRALGTSIVTIAAACLALTGPASAPSQDVSASFSPQEGSVANVTVFDNGFAANEILVPAGTTVVWTNQGRNYHTVTSNQGGFDSGVMQYGDSFYYTFTTPGSYVYHCNYHRREMRGVVYVR